MAIDKQVITVNGQNELIFDSKDIVSIAQNNCGYEYAKIVEQMANTADYNVVLAEQRAQTDADSYCASLESAETCLRDVFGYGRKVSARNGRQQEVTTEQRSRVVGRYFKSYWK